MNELIVKLKAWWQPLAQREKQAVMIGSSAVILFFVYAVMWLPLWHHAATLRQDIVGGQKTLQFMQSAEQQIAQSDGEAAALPQASSPVDFLSYFQKQLEGLGLMSSVSQLKQASQDTVSMKFQQVEFDRLMTMLITIMKAQRVSVAQLTSVATNMPGMVNVDLVLKLG